MKESTIEWKDGDTIITYYRNGGRVDDKTLLSHIKKNSLYYMSAILSLSGSILCYYGWKNWRVSNKDHDKKSMKKARIQMSIGAFACVSGIGMSLWKYCRT